MTRVKPRMRLYIDQYGEKVFAKSAKDLRAQVGGAMSPMYIDGKDGETYKIGYVVGKRWFGCYEPVQELVTKPSQKKAKS